MGHRTQKKNLNPPGWAGFVFIAAMSVRRSAFSMALIPDFPASDSSWPIGYAA